MQTPEEKTIFTLEQATSMLPLLRLIVADISLAHRDITDRRSNLNQLLRRSERFVAGGDYTAEVEAMRNDLREEATQVEAFIQELEALGVTLRSAHDGIVDFPTSINEQPAFFCWKMGEVDILFWRRPNQAYADRMPLPASMRSPESNPAS